MSKKKDTAHEVKPEIPGESDLPEETTTEETTTEETTTEAEKFKNETGFDFPKLGSEKTDKRKRDVLRIRKSNTRNSLFESDLGKQFIAAARAEVKNSEIQEDKHWFIIWEILED